MYKILMILTPKVGPSFELRDFLLFSEPYFLSVCLDFRLLLVL